MAPLRLTDYRDTHRKTQLRKERMRIPVFAAILLVTASAVSLYAEEPAAGANTNFPARVNMRAEILKKYDKDGDGKLNEQEKAAMLADRKAEMDKARQAHEKEFDKNGDGKLDDAERKAMMDARQAQREKFMKEREKAFDKDGDGKLSDEERKAMMDEMQKRHPLAAQRHQEMLKRFDKDGDGKLSDEERKAMMAAMDLERKPAAPALPAEKPATNAVPAKP